MRVYNDYTIHINYVKDGWAIRKGVGLPQYAKSSTHARANNANSCYTIVAHSIIL